MPVSFSTRRLSHRFLLAKTDTCLFLLSLFSFFFSFFLFLLLSIFSLLLLLFYFLKWIISMPSYYLLSVPLLILFHYSLHTEGRRKRRKADLMNLSSWNLQCHLTTLLGMVSHYCHVFAGNYLWWIATLCSLQSFSESLPFFPVSPFSLLPSFMFAKEEGLRQCPGQLWTVLLISITAQEVSHCLNTL